MCGLSVCTVDLAGSTGHGSITQAPDLVASATTPAIQFTQREIQIALPIEAAAVVDYGGVWLGDDDTNNTDQPGLIDYGGKEYQKSISNTLFDLYDKFLTMCLVKG